MAAHTAMTTPRYRRCCLSDAFESGKTKPSKLTTQTRINARRARKYIQNDFPSARPRLADYFTQALGNIIPNTADRLALPVDRTRNRLKVIRELNEVGGVDDDDIAMRSADAVATSSIKHFPVHPLTRQTNPHRTC